MIGVLYADNLTKTGAFSQKNLDLLESIGNQLAGVIEHTRLLDQVRENHKELLVEKEKAQKNLDIAGVIMVALNKKGEITLINQKGNQVLGYQDDDLIGKNWFNTCIPEGSRQEVMHVFNKIMRGKDDLLEYFENAIVSRGGKEKIIAWHNTVLRDGMGK